MASKTRTAIKRERAGSAWSLTSAGVPDESKMDVDREPRESYTARWSADPNNAYGPSAAHRTPYHPPTLISLTGAPSQQYSRGMSPPQSHPHSHSYPNIAVNTSLSNRRPHSVSVSSTSTNSTMATSASPPTPASSYMLEPSHSQHYRRYPTSPTEDSSKVTTPMPTKTPSSFSSSTAPIQILNAGNSSGSTSVRYTSESYRSSQNNSSSARSPYPSTMHETETLPSLHRISLSAGLGKGMGAMGPLTSGPFRTHEDARAIGAFRVVL